MTIRKIARMGHPVLRRVAEEVSDPTIPEIRALVSDMVETMRDAQGTGLAAPQVYDSRRIVIYTVSPMRVDPGEGVEAEVPLTPLVNPVLEPLSDEMDEDWEGCLSVPGLRGLVPRYLHIGLRAIGLDGKAIEKEAHGFHARVLQHEIDHLDGILYPQRMTDLSKLIFESEYRHLIADARQSA